MAFNMFAISNAPDRTRTEPFNRTRKNIASTSAVSMPIDTATIGTLISVDSIAACPATAIRIAPPTSGTAGNQVAKSPKAGLTLEKTDS